MIAFIVICYAALYLIFFNRLKLFKNTSRNISIYVGVGLVLISGVVFAWRTYAPVSGDARVVRYVIPIVSHVKGRVIELPIETMQVVNKGDVLFKLDPRQYQYKVEQAEGQVKEWTYELKLDTLNLDRLRKLHESHSASQAQLDTQGAKVRASEGLLQSAHGALSFAKWELEETVVRAPADGFPAAVQLQIGSMVSETMGSSPIAFVSTEDTDIIASFSQSSIRHIKVSDRAEMVFSSRPGQVYAAKVTKIGRATQEAQLGPTSTITAFTGEPITGRWPIMVELDEPEHYAALPQGAGGTMAVYTDAGKPFHIISKIALRMRAWTGFLTAS